MGSIGDRKDAVQVILPGNGCQAGSGLFCVGALGLSNDLILRDPMGEKVVMADAPFGISRPPATAQGNHQGSEALAIKYERMVKTSAQNRRRAAIVFRCAKNRDGVGRTRLIVGGVEMNLPV